MKTIIAIAGASFGIAWLATPAVELRLALQGPGAMPAHPSIVMLGDSHTEFVNWKILSRCSNISGMGVGGNTTAQMLARLPYAFALSPRLLVVMGGTNDALQNIAPEVTAANLREMEMQTSARGIRFVSLKPPPLHGQPVPAAQGLEIPFTAEDILADGVHLRASGYAKWRDSIAAIVRQYC